MVAQTIQAVSPGSGEQDALASAVTGKDTSEEAGEIALVLGLFFALLSMTTAMAQVERGSNRIYGIRRDRQAVGSTAGPRSKTDRRPRMNPRLRCCDLFFLPCRDWPLRPNNDHPMASSSLMQF